jgi:hypothetical protein
MAAKNGPRSPTDLRERTFLEIELDQKNISRDRIRSEDHFSR